MLPRYASFMKQFPNLKTLASASEEEVVLAWQGLGYYSRARNLRAGAEQVVTEFGGTFPYEMSDAIRIRGVGPYTAAAVLSIAYERKCAVLDGNVERVLSRIYYPPSRRTKSSLNRLAATILGEALPSIHNQSLMELGALVCTPEPVCEVCPLQGQCNAYRAGGIELAKRVPPRRTEKKVDARWSFFAFQRAGAWILVRDRGSRFLKGQWIFPSHLEIAGQKARTTPGFEGALGSMDDLAIRHTITNHRILAGVRVLPFPRRLPNAAANCDIALVPREELANWTASSLGLKLIRSLESQLV